MNCHNHSRLVEIQDEMLDLLTEAKRLVRHEGGISWERAKGYWVAQIETALSNEHDYLGGSMCTMQDTINELEPDEDIDEGEEDAK